MEPQTGRIDVAGIDEDSITNGPGLRFVLFVQGCPHHCIGCHNPQTHAFGVGRSFTVDELYRQVCANPLQTGVTFSGGEPFCQPEPLAELAVRLKNYGYDLAAYTGYTFEQLLASTRPGVRELLEQLDILVDGPFILEKKDYLLNFRGSGNQRILNVPESLKAGTAVLSNDPDWQG